jgi:hypothetical protein
MWQSATLAALVATEWTWPCFASTPMCAFNPKYHCLPFLVWLVHLRVALAARILGRRGRMQDGRIHDRARLDADALGLQMQVHRIQHQTAQIVPLQQVTEPQHRRFVRRTGQTSQPPAPAPTIDAFVASLSSGWKNGEIRPTHRKQRQERRTLRTRADPFAESCR